MANRRPAREKIINLSVVCLLISIGVGAFVLNQRSKNNAQPTPRKHLPLPNILQLEHSQDPADRAKAKRLQAAYDKTLADLLKRHPSLTPAWRHVPDEQNGFLQWLKFYQRHQTTSADRDSASLSLSVTAFDIIHGTIPWDPTTLRTELTGKENLIEELTSIGFLADQSCRDIPVGEWIHFDARFAKGCIELLMADARLASEEGDADRALKRTQAALGLANHLGEIETPTLYSETVVVLSRINIHSTTILHVIPALQPDPTQLRQWRTLLQLPKTARGFDRLLLGECWSSVRALAIPMLSHPSFQLEDREIKDPERFYDAMAAGYLRAATQARIAPLSDFLTPGIPESWFPPAPPPLSSHGQDLYSMFSSGCASWARGWPRAICLFARNDAALAILAGDAPPPEPITGLDFVFDPTARTLSLPEDPLLDDLGITPLTLP